MYVRRPDGAAPHYEGSAQGSSTAAPAPEIPALALQKLEDITNVHLGLQMAYNAERELCRADFDAHRQKKQSVYHAWHTAANDEPGVLVDKNELERWMLAELEAPKKNAGKKQLAQSVASSTDDDCLTVTASQAPRSAAKDSQVRQTNGGMPTVDRHSQSTPSSQQPAPVNGKGKERAVPGPQSSQMEIDTTDDDSELPSAAEIANGSASTKRRSMPGSFVTANRYPASADSPSKGGDSRRQEGEASPSRMVLTNGVQPMDIDVKQSDASDVGTVATPLGTALAPMQPADSKPQNKLEPVTHLNSTAIRCPHGLVSIAKFASLKRISLAGAAALRDLGVTFSPAFSDPDDLCKDCIWTPWSDLAYAHKHTNDLAHFRGIPEKDHRHPVHVSESWLKTWKREKPVFHEANGHVDPAPDWGIYGQHVTCRHGNLEPEDNARTMITSQVGWLRVCRSSRGV